MRSFKNIGASVYRRINNEIVARGDSFTCESEKEEAVIADEGSIGIRLEELEFIWNMRTPPEDYLKRHPTGPKADLARKILAPADTE